MSRLANRDTPSGRVVHRFPVYGAGCGDGRYLPENSARGLVGLLGGVILLSLGLFAR